MDDLLADREHTLVELTFGLQWFTSKLRSRGQVEKLLHIFFKIAPHIKKGPSEGGVIHLAHFLEHARLDTDGFPSGRLFHLEVFEYYIFAGL